MASNVGLNPEVLTYLQDTAIVHYCAVAGAVLYVYDFIITFGDEVEIFWSSRWTLLKFLFFTTRYLALIATVSMSILAVYPNPTPAMCFTFTNYSFVTLVVVSLVEVILLIRLFALYDQAKQIKVPVIALFIVVVASSFGMAVKEALYDHAALVHAGPSSLYGGCTGGVPNWFFIFWTPFMVFDTVLVLLVACKSFQHYHQVPNKQWFGARLVAVLARDSFVFFLVNLMIYLFNTMTWKLAPAGLSEMASFWWLAIPPISATRLLLNLRQVYTQDREIEIELLRSRNSRIRYLR